MISIWSDIALLCCAFCVTVLFAWKMKTIRYMSLKKHLFTFSLRVGSEPTLRPRVHAWWIYKINRNHEFLKNVLRNWYLYLNQELILKIFLNLGHVTKYFQRQITHYYAHDYALLLNRWRKSESGEYGIRYSTHDIQHYPSRFVQNKYLSSNRHTIRHHTPFNQQILTLWRKALGHSRKGTSLNFVIVCVRSK